MEEKKKQTPPGEEETPTPPAGADNNTQTPPGEEETPTPPAGADNNTQTPPGDTSFKAAIEEIKAAYEDRIEKLNAEHKKELDERTEVIKQLLTGNKTVDDAAAAAETISDKINKNRQYEI